MAPRLTFARMCAALLVAVAPGFGQAQREDSAEVALFAKIAALDSALFDTFNRCDVAGF